MVEIIAIVRPNKTEETKKALLEVGQQGFTCVKVAGRGKKPVSTVLPDGSIIKTKLLSKRLFIIEVEEERADTIVHKLMEVNSTKNHGDGKIFVVPLLNSYRVRTGTSSSTEKILQ